jgi:hypothetical protein
MDLRVPIGVVCIVRRLDRVQDAIQHQRRRFELFQRFGLPGPLQFQVLHIRGGDLVQRAVTLSPDVPGIGQPVLRFTIGVEEAVECNLRLK